MSENQSDCFFSMLEHAAVPVRATKFAEVETGLNTCSEKCHHASLLFPCPLLAPGVMVVQVVVQILITLCSACDSVLYFRDLVFTVIERLGAMCIPCHVTCNALFRGIIDHNMIRFL